MIDYVFMLITSIIVIFFASLIFTNVIEYVGVKMRWTRSFTGAIIAPLVTSFPELTVFGVSVFLYGGHSGAEIGIGTILGEPFMASSLAYTLILLAIIAGIVLKFRKNMSIKVEKILVTPYAFIALFFPTILIPYFLRSYHVQVIFAFFFFVGYIYYLWIMYKHKNIESYEEFTTPYFSKIMSVKTAAIVQLILSILGIFFGSKMLVAGIDAFSHSAGVNTLAMAIILVPVATAIPETITAMIWASQGKDSLAISSLVGEKILYATFYPGLALLTVPWILGFHAYISVLATTLISLIYLYYIRKGALPAYSLTFGLAFFIFYIVTLFFHGTLL